MIKKNKIYELCEILKKIDLKNEAVAVEFKKDFATLEQYKNTTISDPDDENLATIVNGFVKKYPETRNNRAFTLFCQRIKPAPSFENSPSNPHNPHTNR